MPGQFRQPDIADIAAGRGRAGAFGPRRPDRARPGGGWRLLPDRSETAAYPVVRRHRLEHAAGLRANRRPRPRDRPRTTRAAEMVRRRRCRVAAPAHRRTARRGRQQRPRRRLPGAAHRGILAAPVPLGRPRRAVNRRRLIALAASGAALLGLTGLALVFQRQNDPDSFLAVALLQGAVYLVAVWAVWDGGSSRRVVLGIAALAALMRLPVVCAPPYL